ncbi:hypothetical protein WJX72_009938 [[Myrmecia] bisecta]|uniref:Ubiquitin-like domain-containing protein n=1 Tax=[Myrmecia] bisecta TaxID=41462 RepID=A0AAW1R8Q5_9CHLO
MQLFVRALNSNTLCIKADTVDELKQRLQEREGIPAGYQRLLYGSRQLADGQPLSDFNLEADATVHLVLRLRGGKGGFGALLRAGGKAALTDNFDACRDLSGRRLRHANAEQKLAEWSAEARKRELEKQAKKALKEQEKQARREERSQVDMDDVRVQQSQALAAVQMAVHSSVAASPPKRKSGDGGAAPSKKAKFYAVADDVSSSDLSDSDEEDEVSGDSRLPLSERAARLFLLKDMPLEQLDKKLFAKPVKS